MKYVIKQKIFSLTDSFEIQDQSGQVVITAKGKFFSISSSQTLFDQRGNELLKIKRKYLTLLPACKLLCADGTEWLVRKRFWPFWTSRFSISGPIGELEILGNLWQHEYEIRKDGKPLAAVSKAWFSWSDTYGVDIFEPAYTTQLLAAVIVIDRIQHSGRNSNIND
ncbi:MAG: LURP-one-related/scramblase family protein [Rheinheimera sp.]